MNFDNALTMFANEEKREYLKKEITRDLDRVSGIEWRELVLYPDGVISLEIDLLERKEELGNSSPFQWVSVNDCGELDDVETVKYKVLREVNRVKGYIEESWK